MEYTWLWITNSGKKLIGQFSCRTLMWDWDQNLVSNFILSKGENVFNEELDNGSRQSVTISTWMARFLTIVQSPSHSCNIDNLIKSQVSWNVLCPGQKNDPAFKFLCYKVSPLLIIYPTLPLISAPSYQSAYQWAAGFELLSLLCHRYFSFDGGISKTNVTEVQTIFLVFPFTQLPN